MSGVYFSSCQYQYVFPYLLGCLMGIYLIILRQAFTQAVQIALFKYINYFVSHAYQTLRTVAALPLDIRIRAPPSLQA
jgi:hypothetical protein